MKKAPNHRGLVELNSMLLVERPGYLPFFFGAAFFLGAAFLVALFID